MKEVEAGAENARIRGDQASIDIYSLNRNKSFVDSSSARKGCFCQDMNIFLGFGAFCNESECEYSNFCLVPGKRDRMKEEEA